MSIDVCMEVIIAILSDRSPVNQLTKSYNALNRESA